VLVLELWLSWGRVELREKRWSCGVGEKKWGKSGEKKGENVEKLWLS